MSIGDIVAGIGSAATGGLLGLIGTAIHGAVAAYKRKKELEHEKALHELRLKEMELEGRMRLQEIKAEAEAKKALAEAEARAAEAKAAAETARASYRADKATYGIAFVDAVRGLMRPLITLYTLGLMTAIAMLLWHAQGAPEDAAADLWRRIVDATLMLATTATTWWFGSRPMRLEGK